MSKHRDLEDMIEALTLTIVIHEREIAFFRRSAAISSSEEAKVLFQEIAEEMDSHVSSLADRKDKLMKRLADLRRH
jgi:rubrerythrin